MANKIAVAIIVMAAIAAAYFFFLSPQAGFSSGMGEFSAILDKYGLNEGKFVPVEETGLEGFETDLRQFASKYRGQNSASAKALLLIVDERLAMARMSKELLTAEEEIAGIYTGALDCTEAGPAAKAEDALENSLSEAQLALSKREELIRAYPDFATAAGMENPEGLEDFVFVISDLVSGTKSNLRAVC